MILNNIDKYLIKNIYNLKNFRFCFKYMKKLKKEINEKNVNYNSIYLYIELNYK